MTAILALGALFASTAHAERIYFSETLADQVFTEVDCAVNQADNSSDTGNYIYSLTLSGSEAARVAQAASDGTLELRAGHQCKYLTTGDGVIDCPEIGTFDVDGDGNPDPIEDTYFATASSYPAVSVDLISFSHDARSDADFYRFPVYNVFESGVNSGTSWREKLWSTAPTLAMLTDGADPCDLQELYIEIEVINSGYANCGSQGGPGTADVGDSMQPNQASVLTFSNTSPHLFIPTSTPAFSCN